MSYFKAGRCFCELIFFGENVSGMYMRFLIHKIISIHKKLHNLFNSPLSSQNEILLFVPMLNQYIKREASQDIVHEALANKIELAGFLHRS